MDIEEVFQLANEGNLDAKITLGKRMDDVSVSKWKLIENHLLDAINCGRELDGYKYLGILYSTDVFSPIYDAKKGVDYLEKYLALGGNDEIIYSHLAFLYLDSESVINNEKAFYYFCKTNKDFMEEQYELANMYINGIGTKPDLIKGVQILKRLKKHGVTLTPTEEALIDNIVIY